MVKLAKGALAGIFTFAAAHAAEPDISAERFSGLSGSLMNLNGTDSRKISELGEDQKRKLLQLSGKFAFISAPLSIFKDREFVTSNAAHCTIASHPESTDQTFAYSLQDNFSAYRDEVKSKTGLFRQPEYNVISLKQATSLGGSPQEPWQLDDNDICAFLPGYNLGEVVVVKTRAFYHHPVTGERVPITSNPPFIDYNSIPSESLNEQAPVLIYQKSDITALPHDDIEEYVTRANTEPGFAGSACLIVPMPEKWALMKLDRKDIFHQPVEVHP